MRLDKYLQLASNQAITSADAYTTLSMDLGNPDVANRIGTGKRMSVFFVVKVAAAGDGSPASLTDTCDFMVAQDTAEGMDAAPVVIIQRRVPAAELVAGAIVEVPIPLGRPTAEFIAGRVELGTDDTITVDAFLAPSDFITDTVAYAKAYEV